MPGEASGPLLEKRARALLCVIARPRLFAQGFEFFVDHNSLDHRLKSALVRLNGERGKPGDLVGAIANEAKLNSKSLGGIEILDRFSLVEVPEATEVGKAS